MNTYGKIISPLLGDFLLCAFLIMAKGAKTTGNYPCEGGKTLKFTGRCTE